MKHVLIAILIALFTFPAFADDAKKRDYACNLHAKIAKERAQMIQKAVKLRKKMKGKGKGKEEDDIWRELLEQANFLIWEEEAALVVCAGPDTDN